MFGFGHAMFTVDDDDDDRSTRCEGEGSSFFAGGRPFLVRISLSLRSGRDLMNSLPEILALITETEKRKGEKAKQQSVSQPGDEQRSSVFVN